MTFNKLEVGKTYYAVSKYKMGNTNMRSVAVHTVVVTSLDTETKSVIASWNHNPPLRVREAEWKKWRSKKPILVKSGFGHRLATREEIKAGKEGEQ